METSFQDTCVFKARGMDGRGNAHFMGKEASQIMKFSFTSQVFTKCSVCSRYCAKLWDTAVDTIDKIRIVKAIESIN